MQIKSLGHAVLKVRNLERSVQFYRDQLGMKEVARIQNMMVFFSLGANHHDLGLMQVGDAAETPAQRSVGLYHLAFKVGDSLDELRACKQHLEKMAFPSSAAATITSANRSIFKTRTVSKLNCMSMPIQQSGAITPPYWRRSNHSGFNG